jgi:hypothetical protein
MRAIISVVALGFLAAGCDPSSSTPDDRSSTDIVARLKSGDQTVCADTSVQQTAVEAVIDPKGFQAFQQEDGKLPAFDTVSATGVKKEVAEVSCSANLTIHYGLVDKVSLVYTVRPSLDQDGGFIVETELTGLAKEALNGWIFDQGSGKRGTEEQQNATVAQEPQPQVEPDAEPSADEMVDENGVPIKSDGNVGE